MGGAQSTANEETFELQGEQTMFRGTASKTALSASELSTYISDRLYVRSLIPRDKAVILNQADPRQRRFAQMRMKMAGKTPETSPRLFKLLDDLKVAHQARGLAAGRVVALAAEGPGLVSQHDVFRASVETTPTTLAVASRKDQLSYGYVDSTLWDDDGNPLGDTDFAEVFGNMRFAAPQSVANVEVPEGVAMEGDSFLIETIAGTDNMTVSYAVSSPTLAGLGVTLTTPVVVDPKDRVVNGSDNFIYICLQRKWQSPQCDYDNQQPGGEAHLKIPLKGSLSISGPGANIDAALIRSYQNGNASPPGRISVTMTDVGGNCKVPPTADGMSMRTFWQHVTLSPATNPTMLSWDLSNPDLSQQNSWAEFSGDCRVTQDRTYLTMDLPIPYVNANNGVKGSLPVTISNAIFQRPLSAPDVSFGPPIRIVNSCLAAGTQIALGSGRAGETRKIEDMHIGDKISNPYASSLTVVDTAVGTELDAMVHITDSRGRELMLTAMHPLYVIGRGMVAAKLLKVGDRVKTDDGTSELTRVIRESYTGKVFNLKVGDAKEALALGVDQTAVFANGFLVGDGNIQSRYEQLEHQASSAGPRRLAKRWRQDYLTSVKRVAAR
jgi:hypothetical protein